MHSFNLDLFKLPLRHHSSKGWELNRKERCVVACMHAPEIVWHGGVCEYIYVLVEKIGICMKRCRSVISAGKKLYTLYGYRIHDRAA